MMEYENTRCRHCEEQTLIYHQYIGDSHCETCGEWQEHEEDGQ